MAETVNVNFPMDRDTYNQYKSVLGEYGKTVKGNLIEYMQTVIEYGISNPETITALEEVETFKKDPNKGAYKTYNSFAEILKELEDEDVQDTAN